MWPANEHPSDSHAGAAVGYGLPVVVRVRRRDHHATVSIAGALDSDSVEVVVRAVDQLADARVESIDIDADDVTFIDLTGWRCLRRLGRRYESAGTRFRLASSSAAVARLAALADRPRPPATGGAADG